MKPVLDGGVKPWVKIAAGGTRPVNCEATYFAKGGRTYVFIVQNAAVTSTSLGDTKTKGLGSSSVAVEVEFSSPVRDVVDERAGKNIGDGAKFKAEFNQAEAVLLSFAGEPPRRRAADAPPVPDAWRPSDQKVVLHLSSTGGQSMAPASPTSAGRARPVTRRAIAGRGTGTPTWRRHPGCPRRSG